MIAFGEKMVKIFFTPFKRWRILLSVLKDAWPVWTAIGVIVAAFWVSSFFSPTPSGTVLYAGTALQGFGLLTVAFGLSKTRQKFGHPSIPTKFLAWFGKLAEAIRPPKPVTIQVGAASIGTSGAVGRATVSAGSGASVEQRLSILEGNLNLLRGELDTEILEIHRRLKDTKENLQRESHERREGIQDINNNIEELAIGGLHLETIGLTWLFIGVIGASIPDEVVKIGCGLLNMFMSFPLKLSMLIF